jgi:hypothetical protein
MTFTSASAASQFVDAICPICPCKADQPTSAQPPLHSRQTIANPTSLVQSQTIHNLGQPDLRHSASALIPEKPAVIPLARQKTHAYNAPSSSSTLHSSSDPVTHPRILSGFEADLANTNVDDRMTSSDLPEPSSSAIAMLPPPTEQSRSPEGEKDDSIESEFLESLKKTPAMYNLSRPQLEDLVAHVVREDGFVKLVCIDESALSFSV